MIQVTLKAKHFYYITNLLKSLPLDMYFSIVNQIKTNTAGKDDDDYVTISASVGEIERVYGLLADRPEGESNEINTEMNTILMPHLQDLANIGNDEAILVIEKIQFIRQNNWNRRDSAIAAAKAFLQV